MGVEILELKNHEKKVTARKHLYVFKSMNKLKICQHCSKNITIAYRIQAQPGKIWEFVC